MFDLVLFCIFVSVVDIGNFICVGEYLYLI